jgi:hypothetical protein
MKRIILAILALCATAAHAQTRVTNCHSATPNNAVCLDWTAPTTHADGMPIVLPITYRVEQRIGTGAWTTTASGISVRRLYLQNLAPGSYEFRGYATVSALESIASNVVGRSIASPPSPPGPPVFTIAVVIGINHAPVYRVTQAGKRDARYVDACGYIEVGKPCHGNVMFDFRGAKFRRVADADVKPWGTVCTGVAPCA